MMLKEHPLLTARRETLVDRLVQLLQEAICSGKLSPEMAISEAGIAKEFGVSRVPAREALQRLEEMNLVRKTYRGREIMKFSRYFSTGLLPLTCAECFRRIQSPSILLPILQ